MRKVPNNFPIPTQAARNCRKFFSLIDDVAQVVQKIRKEEKIREIVSCNEIFTQGSFGTCDNISFRIIIIIVRLFLPKHN